MYLKNIVEAGAAMSITQVDTFIFEKTMSICKCRIYDQILDYIPPNTLCNCMENSRNYFGNLAGDGKYFILLELSGHYFLYYKT